LKPELRVFVLDVGWGDAIFLESRDRQGNWHFALVDSNDTSSNRFTLNFIKRRLQTLGIDFRDQPYFLDFVLLSHGHSDHGQGLKAVMQEFGTKQFWYSKSSNWGSAISLLEFANNPNQNSIQHHQAIDDNRELPKFGDVELEVIWPRDEQDPEPDENNNSVVMTLTLDRKTFLLTGDAEKEVWQHVAGDIPIETTFVKVPHHGSVNGSFDGDDPAWLDQCPQNATLGISCHIGRFGHPDQEVIDLFEQHNFESPRTDRNYHLVFFTDGEDAKVQYHR
jgi:beta-lactamase superfamily II metal-dependent hydrolase